MELDPKKFIQSATIAVENIQLKTALGRSTNAAHDRRRTVFDELDEPYALRMQGRGARLRALHDLPDLLEQFESNMQAKGGNVLWALDGDEAIGHILDICRKHDLKHGVKSKSMATEEIGLLPALEKHGIGMTETDLGEFIVQISHDHPSHIVMPVLHRSKGEIRDIFMETLDMPYVEDANEMTMFARKTLREKFMQADFGMSGGNFLVAETGTLVVVTNEGNGRLSTSLPPLHIAVVGIEKIIPTWEDFATLVQLLPRSATGQRLTVYVNIINGPAQPGEIDGPRDLYIILLDNGRSSVYASEYAEALACIRCGACLNACPVYRNVGGHSYGSVYSGPIGAVITPLLQGKQNASYLPFASSLCGACKEVCPVAINIPDMLLNLRRDLQDTQGAIWQAGIKAWRFGNQHPILFELGGKFASRASRAATEALGDGEKLSMLPYPLNGWTQHRDFPAFAEQSFHDWWRENRAADDD